jgi:hypothetical protein
MGVLLLWHPWMSLILKDLAILEYARFCPKSEFGVGLLE